MLHPDNDCIKINRIGHWFFYCPACKTAHQIRPSGEGLPEPTWLVKQTEPLTMVPSVKVTKVRPKRDKVCHFFIRNGFLEYCGDSTHDMAGQKAAMIPIYDSPLKDWDFG